MTLTAIYGRLFWKQPGKPGEKAKFTISERMRMEIYLSVIVAAYNEAENLETLVRGISHTMANLGKHWEIIIVNDASTDESLSILSRLMTEYPQLRVFSHLSRFGQTAGLDTGFRVARGRYLATLDADLQNDPTDIPRLLEAVESGKCDLANGWRKNRQDPWIRKISTNIANDIRNRLTHENIHDSASGLKVFHKECIERIKMFNGMHRFLPTLVKLEGYRVMEMPVRHHPRLAGKSKYGVSNRLFRALRDTFAVRWMQSRVIRPQFEELEVQEDVATESAGNNR